MSDHIDRLLARARQLALPAQPAPSPSDLGQIVIPWNCGKLVRPFAVLAAPQGNDTLALLGNAPLSAGTGAAGSPPAALGSFRLDAAKWPGCPHCGTKHNRSGVPLGFWFCSACGTFNCPGDRDGLYRCACGNVATRDSFVTMETFAVRGARSGAITPRAAGFAPPIPVPPPVAPARVPASVRLAAPPGPPPLRLPGRR